MGLFSQNNAQASQSTAKELVPAPQFVPTYLEAPVVNNPYGGSETLNPIYFATEETAREVGKLLGALSVVSQPFTLGGGFFTNVTVPQWTVRFIRYGAIEDQNAGLLADYITREGVYGVKQLLKNQGFLVF